MRSSSLEEKHISPWTCIIMCKWRYSLRFRVVIIIVQDTNSPVEVRGSVLARNDRNYSTEIGLNSPRIIFGCIPKIVELGESRHVVSNISPNAKP